MRKSENYTKDIRACHHEDVAITKMAVALGLEVEWFAEELADIVCGRLARRGVEGDVISEVSDLIARSAFKYRERL